MPPRPKPKGHRAPSTGALLAGIVLWSLPSCSSSRPSTDAPAAPGPTTTTERDASSALDTATQRAPGRRSTCPLAEPRRQQLALGVQHVIGPVGEATWALVGGPDAQGILTVGADGAPQISLSPFVAQAFYPGEDQIWFLEARPPQTATGSAGGGRLRLVSFDVSDALEPRVGQPEELPFELPGVDAFAIGASLAVFIHQGRAVIWNRHDGSFREHALGTDQGNYRAWCGPAACFVAAQTEIASLRLRLRLWSLTASGPTPAPTLVADEAARDVISLPDGDGRWLLWTRDNVIRARRVNSAGAVTGPVVEPRSEAISPGTMTAMVDETGRPAFLSRIQRTGEIERSILQGPTIAEPEPIPLAEAEVVLATSTPEGTLYLAPSGELAGVNLHRGHSHRWFFSAVTLFWPAGGAPQPPVELFRRSGGGLFTVNPLPISSPGGFAVVFLFGYHPWEEPDFWLLRGPCPD